MTTPVIDKDRRRTIDARIERLRQRAQRAKDAHSLQMTLDVVAGILDLLDDML